MANGQGSGDTETGSYDLSLGIWATRGTNATWVLPSEDEWYKAAYYDAENDVYYDYPNGSDDVPAALTDETTPREMNFGSDPYWQGNEYYTSIGETTGASPFGVNDMGGNVQEWTETFSHGGGEYRISRGGAFNSDADGLAYSGAIAYPPWGEGDSIGLRIAYIIPEPSTLALFVLGALGGICGWMRRKRR
jgi:formylglycine-generating enzyme required for sulfatase activity